MDNHPIPPQALHDLSMNLPPAQAASTANNISTANLRITNKDTTAAINVAILNAELTPSAMAAVPRDEPPSRDVSAATQLVHAYLFSRSPEFARVVVGRGRGWNNTTDGDAHFKRQRERADAAGLRDGKAFFDMMMGIAVEMEAETGALRIQSEGEVKVLDICAAPGGYTAAIQKLTPTAQCYIITLPSTDGGHNLLLPSSTLAGCKFSDVTLLAGEFIDPSSRIPESHPDYARFIRMRPFRAHKFHLVLCDGIVLRTHIVGEHRAQRDKEAVRLGVSQRILAMQRVVQGGTIVMLMHKVDEYRSVKVLWEFSRFSSSMQTFKPTKRHAVRSSFYVIAKGVDTECEAFKELLRRYREEWWETTFGGVEGTGALRGEEDREGVLVMLAEFGEELIRLGTKVWRIQEEALGKTKWAGEKSGDGEEKTENSLAVL